MPLPKKKPKWGLEIRKKPQPQNKRNIQRHSLFTQEAESSEDEDISKINTNNRRHYERQRQIKAEREYREVLAEDSTAFQYDEVYDQIIAGRKAKLKRLQNEKVARKSKYIKGLMANAAIREKLNRASKENMLKLERMKTDHVYEDKQKFVTRAYTEKLNEEKRLQKLIELKDKQDREDQGNFNNFYASVYKDLHKGGGRDKEETSSSSDSSSSDSESSSSSDHRKKSRKRRGKFKDRGKKKKLKLSEREMKERLKKKELNTGSVNSAKERYLARMRKQKDKH